MSRLALSLLGPPRVEHVHHGCDGQPVQISRRKVMALLAYLAVEGGTHGRDALATLLWPENSQSRARAYLRRELSDLNRILGGGFLIIDRETVGLRRAQPDSGRASPDDAAWQLWLDVHEFRERLAACAAHGHPTTEACTDCLAVLEEAVALYCGDFMAGFTLRDCPAFDEWQFFKREGLRNELAGALQRLVRWYSAHHEHEHATACARRWLALDPLQEAAHRRLMKLYARSGQRNAALRQYRECVRLLELELGVRPEQETTALYEHIRDGSEGIVGPSSAAGPPRIKSIPHNLPAQPTPFVGRETELADLDALIADPDVRLITIVGPGGMGKTRLAIAFGEKLLQTKHQLDQPSESRVLEATTSRAPLFPHGVFFVPFAPLTSVAEIVPTLAKGLGFQVSREDGRTPEQQVLDYLREKQLLLILDNLEHLLDSAGIIIQILKVAPDVQILVTSRDRLPMQQAFVFAIQGLEYREWKTTDEAAEYPSTQLFLQSARRVQRDFDLLVADLQHLYRICRLAQGMPLALELAASWVDNLSLAGIATEMQRNLDFLESEWRDVPARHRSMRAALESSWCRLTRAQQHAFAELCVFRGSFTRKAALEVAEADLRTLATLAEKSMLTYSRAPERYELHELLRQFGAEKLGMDPEREAAARDRHSAFFCVSLDCWNDALNRRGKVEETTELIADWANVRAAWEEAACQGNVTRLDQALDGLWYFTTLDRTREVEAMYGLACDGLTANARPLTAAWQRVLARALLYQSGCNADLGRWDLARPLIQQGRALLENPALADRDTRSERACLHVMTGYAAFPVGDWEKARWHYEQALTLQRNLGHEAQVAFRLLNIGFCNMSLGECDQAKQAFEESLALFRTLGNQMGVVKVIGFLGDLAFSVGNRGEAQSRQEEALSLAHTSGFSWDSAKSQGRLGWLAIHQGDFQGGADYMHESVSLFRTLGTSEWYTNALTGLSSALRFCGDFDQAYTYSDEGLALAEVLETPWELGFATVQRAWLDLAVGRYGAARTLAQKTITTLQGDERLFLLARASAHVVLGWVALAEASNERAAQALQTVITLLPGSASVVESQEKRSELLAVAARAAHGTGNHKEARQHLLEGLAIAVEFRVFIPLLHLVPIIAVVLVDEVDPSLKQRALELYALAESQPFIANSQLFEDVAGRHIRAATASLPPKVVEAAQARGRTLDWWETAEGLLVELRELGWAGAEG